MNVFQETMLSKKHFSQRIELVPSTDQYVLELEFQLKDIIWLSM